MSQMSQLTQPDRLTRPSVRALANQAFSRAAGAPLIEGNRVILLKDAQENYPAWLVVLPLLATQLLWINLVTDGAPALALGVDPPHGDVMRHPPRPRDEGVITNRMWFGILFVGSISAAGTLVVLDWSLPGGLIEGSGSLRYAQTMAFTTMVFFSIFTVFNARSDERTAFAGLFSNKWLWAAIVLALLLQAAVIYIPFLQQAFSTVGLSAGDWLRCAAVASSVLWLREVSKLITRASPMK